MKNKHKGFTLPEILISLTVLGFIASTVMPIIFKSQPEKKVINFKYANAKLFEAISELVRSDKYYLNGDLGIMPNGKDVNSSTYFCESLAETISAKKVNCSTNTLDSPNSSAVRADLNIGQVIDENNTVSMESIKNDLDTACAENTDSGAELTTQNKIVFYQTSPGHHFGWKFVGDSCYNGKRYFGGIADSSFIECMEQELGEGNSGYKIGDFLYKDAKGMDRIYKVFCMDVDGINQGEAPFGYGIRADGKILTGARADSWSERSIKKDENMDIN